MLSLGKKTDYALISLAWLAEHDERYISAREIAEGNGLPLPVLMQILKILHQNGVLRSARGVKGGYQIAVCLEALSLLELSQMLTAGDGEAQPIADAGSTDLLLEAVRRKLSQFLQGVTVAEVIRTRWRIDVPLKELRILDRLTV